MTLSKASVILFVFVLFTSCKKNKNEINPDEGSKQSKNWTKSRGDLKNTGIYNGKALQKSPIIDWMVELESYSNETSPVVADGVIYTTAANKAIALDMKGTILWEANLNDSFESAPILDDSRIYLGSRNGNIFCVDKKNGNVQWKRKLSTKGFSNLTIAEETLFFGDNDGYFFALDANTGKEIWSHFDDYGYYTHCPAIDKGIVYASSHYMYAFDAKSGQLKWQYNCGSVEGSPVINGNELYVTNSNGKVYSLNIETGQENWMIDTKDYIATGPTLYGDLLIFGNLEDNVLAINVKTKKQEWIFKTGNWILSSPVIADGIVYIGSMDNNMYAINAKNGEEVWRFECTTSITNSPVLYDGKLFFGDDDGYFYSLK